MFNWPTFVLDLANNHNGSVKHGLDIIRAHAEVVHKHGVSAAIKFQWRDLENYQHGDEAYANKFAQTDLGCNEELIDEVRKQGLAVAATAFDPGAAYWLGRTDVDICKVASCSAKDDETLDAILVWDKPTIVSTGGLTVTETAGLLFKFIDVQFPVAAMHCVSLYPTPLHRCDLSRIAALREYGIPIGWSTHEDPDAATPVQMAVAYGATIFERHIGLGGENGYSSSPEQLDKWIDAYKCAVLVVGEPDRADRSDELAALARVARRHQGDSDQGQHRSRAALDRGAVAPSRP